jgi:arylsulfatase A-like enzyme
MKAIILTLNGCSLAALGPYGNEWIATPNLDQLAAESCTFDRHISCCPEPNQARQVWLQDGLLDQLKAANIPTILVRNNRAENDGPAEFYAGWGELFDARPDSTSASPADPLVKLLPNILDSLQKHEQFLLWIDCDRLLPPWDAPQDLFDIYVEDLLEEEPAPKPVEDEEDSDVDDSDSEESEEPDEPVAEVVKESVPPWANPQIGWFDQDDLPSWELLHRTYAAAITAFDADLGKIFNLLREYQFHENATWFFTADRGFPLGEHGMIGPHRPWLHEELVHLPLIVRPAGRFSGKRVPAITQPADFASTLAKGFGVSTPNDVNLLTWATSNNGPSRELAMSQLGEEKAIRTPNWTLLKCGPRDDDEPNNEVQLYQMPEDRWEVNDIWRQHEAIVEELLAMMEQSGTSVP